MRVAVAAVLKWRRPQRPQVISFMLDENEVIATAKKPLGCMCTYVGPNNPVTASEDNVCEGFVQVNPRDFMAAFQRFLSVKNVFAQDIKLSHACAPYKFLLETCDVRNISAEYLPFDPATFPLPMPDEDIISTETERIPVSIIKALAGALRDEVVAVRETAASSLGTLTLVDCVGAISLPEAIDAVDSLISAVKDPDSNVRAMCAWAVGRLGTNAGLKVALSTTCLGGQTDDRAA